MNLRSAAAQVRDSVVTSPVAMASSVTRQTLAATHSRSAIIDRRLARRRLGMRIPAPAVRPKDERPPRSATLIWVRNVQALEVVIIVPSSRQMLIGTPNTRHQVAPAGLRPPPARVSCEHGKRGGRSPAGA